MSCLDFVYNFTSNVIVMRLNRNSLIPLSISLSCLVLISTAQATLISFEGFDYTAGTTLTGGTEATSLNGGSGWNTPWFRDYSGGVPRYITNNVASVETDRFSGQSASPFTPVGNSAVADATSDRGYREFAVADAANAFNVASSGAADAVYFSFLYKDTATNNGISFTILDSAGGNSASVGVGQNRVFSASATGGTLDRDFSVINANTDYFVVFKLTSPEDSLSVTAEASFYTVAGNVPSSEPASWNVTSTGTFGGDVSLNALRFQSVSIDGGTEAAIDEIRVGSSYIDVAVIPESSTLAFSIGSLVLICTLYRRRRQHSF